MSSFGVIEKIKTINKIIVNKEHLSNNMKKIFTTTLIFSFILFNSCEEVNVAYPGNTQNLDSKSPTGSIEWSIDSDEQNNGELPENSAGISIGTIVATDLNPDDEFTYDLTSQRDGNNVELNTPIFSLFPNTPKAQIDSGFASLRLEENANVNYEALSGSKQYNLTILVTDDSPERESSSVDVTIKVIDVNETPYFTNLGQIRRYADEYVDYDSPRVEWSDTDEGDNPTLTHNIPSDSWLALDAQGNFSLARTIESSDVGNQEFVLTISDGEITVQEEINIEVRENVAPVFTNLGSIPSAIRVGCYDDNDNIVDLSWSDPNNDVDDVTFTHQGTEDFDWINFDNDGFGKLFCVRAPENGDAGTASITISLQDDRPTRPLTTEHSFELELVENDAPILDISEFSDTIPAGETTEIDINWQDPNGDVIEFDVDAYFSWLDWDSAGNLTLTPTDSHAGTYSITLEISDGCYITTVEKTFTVQ